MSKRDDRLAKRAQGREKFHGFEIPESNYFRMPNTWTDICTEIDNLAELKIVQYVLRHTWGYREYGEDFMKAITIDEFMFGRKRKDGSRIDKGTGIKSDRSVRDGIECAIADGYLICIVDDSDLGRIKKYYTLNLFKSNEQIEQEVEEQKVRVVTSTTLNKRKQGGNNHHPESHMLPPHGVNVTPRTEKETREVYLGKEKDTAQSPNGDVCLPSFPSSISTHRKERPRPTEQTSTPEHPKQIRTRKPDVDPEMLEQAKATIQREIGGRMIWESRDVSSVKKMLEQGATCEEISIVIQRLKADPFHLKNLTIPYISKHFGNQLAQSKLTYINTSTQDKPTIDYNDPNFNPGTLSFPEYAAWTEWKQQHQPAS